MCGLGGVCGWGCAWPGGMHGKGGHVWQRGACVANEGVHGKVGVCGKGGPCVAKGGMHGMHAPLGRLLRDMVGQCVGGTHPTGMHSCYLLILLTSIDRSCRFYNRSSCRCHGNCCSIFVVVATELTSCKVKYQFKVIIIILSHSNNAKLVFGVN